METKDVTQIRRPFMQLLIDAIRFTLLSGEEQDDSQQRTFTRAAIMNCVFAVECAANCILQHYLQHYPTSKKFREELDNLRLLSKFEFLLVIYGKKLERGCKEVQGIQELIDLRNHYVHPKPKEISMTYSNDGSMPTFNLKAEPELTNNLRIPLHPMGWNSQHAVTALKALIEFLNFFFVTLCKLTPEEAQRYLLVEFKVEEQTLHTLPLEVNSLFTQIKNRWGIEVQFISWDVNTSKGG